MEETKDKKETFRSMSISGVAVVLAGSVILLAAGVAVWGYIPGRRYAGPALRKAIPMGALPEAIPSPEAGSGDPMTDRLMVQGSGDDPVSIARDVDQTDLTGLAAELTQMENALR